MNCFKTNEPFRLVVENYCNQQIIYTKKFFIYIFFVDFLKKSTYWLHNLKKITYKKIKITCAIL